MSSTYYSNIQTVSGQKTLERSVPFGIPASSTLLTEGNRIPLAPDRLISQLDEMRNWPENWNGYDVAAPNQNSIKAAKKWISSLYCYAMSQGTWKEPLASPDENGDVAFNWFYRARNVTVYLSSEGANYLKGGHLVEGENDEGEANTDDDREALWNWLTQ